MYLWYVYKLHVHASIVACNGASYMHVYVCMYFYICMYECVEPKPKHCWQLKQKANRMATTTIH